MWEAIERVDYLGRPNEYWVCESCGHQHKPNEMFNCTDEEDEVYTVCAKCAGMEATP